MAFDPSKPFEVIDRPKGFDPSAPFEVLPSPSEQPATAAPPADNIPTYTVRPGDDETYDRNMIPRGDAPRTEPSKRPGVMERFGTAVGSAFKGPYGPSKETMAPLTQGPNMTLNAVNKLAVDAPLTVLDALGRPVTAAVRGAAALAGGIGEAAGMNPNVSDQLERDVNAIGDIGTTLSTAAPPVSVVRSPVKPSTTNVHANRLQDWIAHLAEIEPDELERVRKLAAEGYAISPAYAQGLPSLRRYVDMARALGYDPTGRSSTRLARDRTQQILEQMGKTPEEATQLVNKLMGPYTPTLEDAAEQIGKRASNIQSRVESENSIAHAGEAAAREAEIGRIEQNAQTAATVKSNVNQSAIDRLAREKANLTGRLDDQIKQGWAELENTRRSTSPTLSEDFPAHLDRFRTQLSRSFSEAYDQALDMAGEAKVDAATMRPAVKNFLDDMPEDLKRNQPALIRSVTAIAENGTASLPELQHLRSALRDMADYDSLEPSFKKGPYKYFAGVVNKLIHNEDVPTQWRDAVKHLDRLDTMYGDNMAIWRDKAAQNLLDQTRAGVAPNPAYVVNVLNAENQTARRRALLNIATPELRQQVWGATVDDLIQRSLAPDVYGTDVSGPAMINPKAFLKNVVDLDQSGVLRDYSPTEAGRIVTLARRIAQKSGDIEIDPKSLTDNGFVRTLQNIHDTDKQIAERLKRDPAAVLKDEMAAAQAKIKDVRKRPSDVVEVENPIGEFATTPRNLINVTESLLQPENINLLRRTVKTLGEDSPEIALLRERATESILKPFLDVDPKSRRVDPEGALKGFKKLSKNTQDILFPGITENAITELASEMRTIVGDSTKTMPGFAANAIIDDPNIKERLKNILFYRGMAYVVTRPTVAKMFIGEMKSNGNAVTGAKLAVRDFVNNALETELRAAVPMTEEQRRTMPEPPKARPPRKTWQERMMEGGDEQPKWMKGFARGGSVDAYTAEDNPLSPHLLSMFQEAADRYKVPLPVLLSIARRESNFNPRARGSSGEIGLMQVMPSTAQQPGYGVDPVSPDLLADPRTNIDFGAKYLAAVGRNAGATDLSDPDQLAKALLRYNGGGDPKYVQNVTQYLPYYSENVLPQSGSSVPDIQTVETVPEEIIAPNQMAGMPDGSDNHDYSPQQVMKVLAYVQQLIGNRVPGVG